MRDFNDKWIRVKCNKGDMIVLPEGIYHRYTLDSKNYTKVLVFVIPLQTVHTQSVHLRVSSNVECYLAGHAVVCWRTCMDPMEPPPRGKSISNEIR